MNPEYPVYVISKNRAESCLTARELSAMGVPFFLVVEPQDADAYVAAVAPEQLLVLPFSNLGQGSIPVRNWVWQHSVESGFARHWVLDDNIEGFHRLHENEKYKVSDGTIFKCCEDFVDRYGNIGLAGMNYHSFCKTSDRLPPYYRNTRIYSCILVDNSLPFKWRGKFNEDTDLSLRVLKSGLCTVLFNAFLIGKVTTMRMTGGNTGEVYGDTDNRREFAESLAEQHPDVAKVVWRFDRWHHQVDYSSFKRTRLKLKDGIEIEHGINNYGMVLKEQQ